MTLLALETTATCCQVALYDGVRLEVLEARDARHSRVLFALVSALLERTGCSLRELSGIAVCHGPGAFTGLRMGVAVAQGLAYAAALPVLPVSSLAALAWRAVTECGAGAGQPGLPQPVLATIDARRGQVYCGWYECEAQKLLAMGTAQLCDPPAIPAGPEKEHGPSAIIAGSGLQYVETFPDWAKDARARQMPHLVPGAKAVAELGMHGLRHNAGIDPMQLSPLYIRNKVTD